MTFATEKKKAFLMFLLRTAVICVVIIALFKTVLMLCVIPSESMRDTLQVGDILIGTRLDAKSISRYDIMVFIPPDNPNTYYIKRVIGMPGETIRVKNGSVYANGKKLKDGFVRGVMNTSGDGTYKVPKGHYFMMGDNRNNSEDSRFWTHKYVPLKNFVCHSQFIIYPFSRIRKTK